MKFNKGFSMVGLMAVVAIVAIMAVVSLPVYNQYIERTKVSKEVPVIGTYKNDIASCFMKNDSLEDCNDGESGIHPSINNEGNILSLNVVRGNIIMIINAQNHVEDVEPVELMYVVNPQLDATFPTLDWNLYCNDYSSDNNALVKECKGLITDKDGDGYNDSVEEEWGSDPLDPDSVPVNWVAMDPLYTDWVDNGRTYTSGWSPEASNQTSNFTQTRNYEETQTRERTDRERDTFSGDIRVVDVVTETQTTTGQESRNVVVNNTSGGWVDTGSAYACSDWTPPASDYYETQMIDQTRVCSQDQESTYNYSVGGSFTDTQTVNVTEERTVEGTQTLWVDISNDVSDWTNVGSRSYTSSWEPNIIGQTSDFTQTRSYTQEQERTISEREENQLTGDVRVVSSTTEIQTIAGQESRNVSVSETAWQNVGGVFDCSAWSPATSTVDEGQTFTQSRDCLQEQEKTYTYSANGSTIGSMTINRDVQTTQTRQATGTNPAWVSIAPSYGTWTDVGSRTYTSNWSPAATNQTSDFTQTRSYTQEQERTVSQREENSSTGDIRVVSTSTETRTISESTSRTVTVSEGAWINDGSVYSCGAWSPALGNQTSDFTQTRSCSQDQTKTYTYSVGGSFVDTQTVTVTQSQVVEVTSTAGGSGDGWSSWSTYNTSCGGWGPSTANYPQGQTFTQTRSCTDYQERFKYFVVNGQVVDSDRQTRTSSRTETRTATGSKAVSCTQRTDVFGSNNTYFIQARLDGGQYGTSSVDRFSLYVSDSVGSPTWTGDNLPTASSPITVNGTTYYAGNAFYTFGVDGAWYEVCSY
jgi:hypothetical protein